MVARISTTSRLKTPLIVATVPTLQFVLAPPPPCDDTPPDAEDPWPEAIRKTECEVIDTTGRRPRPMPLRYVALDAV
jgi:hypothetical protein